MKNEKICEQKRDEIHGGVKRKMFLALKPVFIDF